MDRKHDSVCIEIGCYPIHLATTGGISHIKINNLVWLVGVGLPLVGLGLMIIWSIGEAVINLVKGE